MGGKKNFFTPLLNVATLGGYGSMLKAKEQAKQMAKQNQAMQEEMNKLAEAQNKNIVSDETNTANTILSENKKRRKGLLGTLLNRNAGSNMVGGNSGL